LANYNPHIDLISIQFYESYSDAAMAVHHYGTSPQDYIVNYIQDLANRQFQFYVDFSQDNAVNMGAQFVSLPLNKLVIGLANGWALDNGNTEKVLYISPEQVQNAFVRLQESNSGDLSPRGFMFWTIEERGTNGVYLAKGLGQFLHDKS
jgi:chitinase